MLNCLRESALNFLHRLIPGKVDAGLIEVDKQQIYPIIISITGLPTNTSNILKLFFFKIVSESLDGLAMAFKSGVKHFNQTFRLFLHCIKSKVNFLTK